MVGDGQIGQHSHSHSQIQNMNKTTQSVCLDRVDSQDTAGHFGVAVLLEFHFDTDF